LILRNLYVVLDNVVIPEILDARVMTWGDKVTTSTTTTKKGAAAAASSKDVKKSSTGGGSGRGATGILTEYMELFQKHRVFPSVFQQFFCQIFYYIDAKLFNALMQRKDLCSCHQGFQIKLGLSQLEEWINKYKNEKHPMFSRIARDYLGHITEASNVLVVDKKMFLDGKMIEEHFSTLNAAQIKHLLDRYQTDQFSTEPVSREVLDKLGQLSKKDKNSELEIDVDYLLSFPKTNKKIN